MEFIQFFTEEKQSYIESFKKHKLIYRKYPKDGLIIIKQQYNAPFSKDHPWINYCRGLISISSMTNEFF